MALNATLTTRVTLRATIPHEVAETEMYCNQKETTLSELEGLDLVLGRRKILLSEIWRRLNMAKTATKLRGRVSPSYKNMNPGCRTSTPFDLRGVHKTEIDVTEHVKGENSPVSVMPVPRNGAK